MRSSKTKRWLLKITDCVWLMQIVKFPSKTVASWYETKVARYMWVIHLSSQKFTGIPPKCLMLSQRSSMLCVMSKIDQSKCLVQCHRLLVSRQGISKVLISKTRSIMKNACKRKSLRNKFLWRPLKQLFNLPTWFPPQQE
jgi:hypothetical protein